MIPKLIHYCWFGGNPLPESAKKCIESWKKYCPDYEIVEWNESNFDVNCCDYVREAYKAKKWAFVSDYARFKILYEYGGMYFDTDVEIIKSLENIIAQGSFMGCENSSETLVNPGLGLAATPGLELYKELLEAYNSRHFLKEDGSLNLKTVVDYTTEILTKHGLKNINQIQSVAGINVYPQEYFCPMNYVTGKITITSNTFSIHHYTASWYDDSHKYALNLKKKYGRIMPKGIAAVLAVAVAKTKYDGFKACLKWIFKKRR